MFKIQKYVQIISFVFILLDSEAQCILFTYDNAGNRTQRKYDPICILALTEGNGGDAAAKTDSVTIFARVAALGLQKTILYPNPATSQVAVRTTEFSEAAQVAVYNSAGYIVFTTGLTSDRIDILHLPPGLYVFLLTEQRGEQLISYKQKIIKQ